MNFTSKPLVMLAIKSCWHNAEKRQAIRDSWLRRLDRTWFDYTFIVGQHAPKKAFASTTDSLYGEADVRAYPVRDDFKNIAPKIRYLMVQAAAQEYIGAVVVDDDTYVEPERLKQRVATLLPNEYVGFIRENAGWQRDNSKCFMNNAGHESACPYIAGSAYMVGWAAMQMLAADPGKFLKNGVPDDVAVGLAMHDTSWIKWVHDERFWPGPTMQPLGHRLITTHKVTPAEMRSMQ